MKLKAITCILLMLGIILLSLGLPSVSAPGIPPEPIRRMTVASNETFVLTFKMRFDGPDPGFFSLTFYWDNNESDPNGKYWNFTYEGFKCWFTDGTNFSITISVTITKGSAPGLPGVYRYAVTIDESDGEIRNGDFWVNVTMRAAGVVNGTYIPHTGGEQEINFTGYYGESTIIDFSGYYTIRVAPKIFSCDSTGVSKEIFNVALGEAVYVKGYGFNSSGAIRLYVVPNTTWTDGQAIGTDVRGGTFNFTSADSAGNLAPYALGLLPIGEYDIVADASPYGYYGVATDAADDVTSSLFQFSHPETISIFQVHLEVDAYLPMGFCLTVKFYSYRGLYQGNVTVWNGTASAYVTLSMNVSHPLDKPLDWNKRVPVERATLVLTDENGTIISSITTFVMTRTHLFSRLLYLIGRIWPWVVPKDRIPIFREIVYISKQWPYAPT